MASAPALDVTPRQALDKLQAELGLTDDDLVGALAVSHRSLQRWRTGTAHPQQEARQKLARLLRLLDEAREAFEGGDAPQTWAHGSSRYLGGITPAEAIRAGRIDRAEAVLGAIYAGIYL